MHVVICSLVKNAMKYLPAYRKQLEALVLPVETTWTLCILEGDSNDGTWDYLVQWASECDRIVIGRENVGETASGEGIDGRAERWARAGNACLDLTCSVTDFTHVMWLESDLCFPLDLLSRLLSCNVDIVAPMIWIGGHFYDTWGFRDLNCKKWGNFPPYHRDYRSNALIEMGSVGSCVLARRAIVDSGIRFRGPYEDGLIVGICNDARSKGFRVFVDTSTSILHPVSLWADQMWKVVGVEIVYTKTKVKNLSLEEIVSLGIEQHIALLTPESLVYANRGFLKNVFKNSGTNRINMVVVKEPSPSRRYRMKIIIEEPQGVAKLSWAFKIFLLGINLDRVKISVQDDIVFIYTGFLSNLADFRSNISINQDI